ncbi:MAG: hypothetical protein AAF351_13300 [Pseudomonadota bacterium]
MEQFNRYSKNTYVAALFVFALCGWVISGIETYDYVDYQRHAVAATMELAVPAEDIVQYQDVLNTRVVDVRYQGDSGELVVEDKVVLKDQFDRLVAGDAIPIVYLTNNPHRIFNPYSRPKLPWIWIAVAIAGTALALFALRLRRRQTANTE